MLLEQGIVRASDTSRPGAFSELLEGFLLSRQVENCTPQTLRTYEIRIGSFFKFLTTLGCKEITQVTRSHVELYLLHFKENNRSPHYIQSIHRALATFFKWCQGEELIHRSPMGNMKLPKTPKVGKPFITEQQRDKLLSLCPPSIFLGARDGAIVWTYWTTGMRLEELTNLELTDLDWRGNRIRVFGKGRKERFVPFTKEAKKAIWRYLCYRKDDHRRLWLTEERRPITKWGITLMMKKLVARAGLKSQVKDANHVFRRSWAMRNLKAGVPIKYVQLVGGWESIRTLEQYVRAMESEEALEAKWV